MKLDRRLWKEALNAAAAIELAELITTTHLHGQPAVRAAAALADCLARLLARYDDATALHLLEEHIDTVRQLTTVNRRILSDKQEGKRHDDLP
jgi:hypothetical protein